MDEPGMLSLTKIKDLRASLMSSDLLIQRYRSNDKAVWEKAGCERKKNEMKAKDGMDA